MRDPGTSRPPVSHQTVKLVRGKHSSPEDGVCVMELASMLAGEEFTDRPSAVSPVIGSFLRAYNDRVDDRWRQDLYPYAAKVVGTRRTIEIEHERAQMCREWARQTRAGGALPAEPAGRPHPPGRLRRWLWTHCCRPEHAGRRAATTLGRSELGSPDHGGHGLDDGLHREVLRFADQLIAVGECDKPQVEEIDGFAVKEESESM